MIVDFSKNLQGAGYFSKINHISSYNKLRVKDCAVPKKVSTTLYGHYKFAIMSLGLTNSLVDFMDLLKRVFQQYLDFFIIFLLIISTFTLGMKRSM